MLRCCVFVVASVPGYPSSYPVSGICLLLFTTYYSQFLMALCTWVHYNTFVKLATVSVPKLTYMYSLLSTQEKKDFLESISLAKAKIRSDFGLA